MALIAIEQAYGQPTRFVTIRGTIVANTIQAECDNSAWLAAIRNEMKKKVNE